MFDSFILDRAHELYGVTAVQKMPKGYTENIVYETQRDGVHYFLRVAPYTPQKQAYTEFEVKWMHYLATNMDGVVAPQFSCNHLLAECCEYQGTKYIFCLFEKAPGQKADPEDASVFNTQLFFNLGALLANMHNLTVQCPLNCRIQEFEWDDPTNSWRYQNEIADKEVRFWQTKYHDMLKELPIDQNTYGIIHWDLHLQNFLVENGNITAFDFDAFQFNWYTADIASALFFLFMYGAGPLTEKTESQRGRFGQSCITALLKGYLSVRELSAFWIRKIDLFIKYQMCDEYLAGQSMTGWDRQEWYLQWHKNRIVNNMPYIEINYDQLLEDLGI